MKVIINIKPRHNTSKSRGIGVYTRELARSLHRYYKRDEFIITSNLHAVSEYDLVHYPFFDPFFRTLKPPRSTKTVVTIHDVIPLKFKEHFPTGIRGKINFYLQKKTLSMVDHIITDSNSSKSDIIELLDIDSEKITVIPLAPSANIKKITNSFTQKIKKKYNLPEKYFLYVGDINWNKNVPGLIEEYSRSDSDAELILVGKALRQASNIPEIASIKQAIDQSPKKEKIRKLGYVPDHHMPAVYSLATIYVQPSYYEGFGFPVLEAMQNGCPVISSNLSSLPEVAGDSALYFDPYKKNSLKVALEKLISNPKARRALTQKGIKRVKDFSWRETAKLTREVYSSVVNES